MIDYSKLLIADQGQDAHTILLLDPAHYPEWLLTQPQKIRDLLEAQSFKAGPFEIAIINDEDSWSVVYGMSDINNPSPWCLAAAPAKLPPANYRISIFGQKDQELKNTALGWLLSHYSFDQYLSKTSPKDQHVLLSKDVAMIDEVVKEAQATALVRDMVNTPPIDMGPNNIEKEAEKIAKIHKADFSVIRGDDLETGYPLIHAVGMAAMREHAPRLIELEWGDKNHPRIAIIGKGISFDTGGLDIKSAVGMRLMKKDMGGAAHALALADLIMKSRLPVRLHMLIPAAENSVSGNALRPGDVIKSRKGIQVEIHNTDAEGRLVLADAFTKAAESEPELMIDFATLTGAARVALGPDLPAFFCNDDDMAQSMSMAGQDSFDPLWQLPLWKGYNDMLSSDIADISNAGGSFAGSITAALFLQNFVEDTIKWGHFDTFAWRPAAAPGRPKGGEALGLRAAYHYLSKQYPAR